MTERIDRLFTGTMHRTSADERSDAQLLAAHTPELTDEERHEVVVRVMDVVTRHYEIDEVWDDPDDPELRAVFAAVILGIVTGVNLRDRSMAGTL